MFGFGYGFLIKYIGIPLLALAVMGGGWLYVKHLKSSRDYWKAEAAAQQATVEFFKKAAKIDADTAKHKEEINEAVKSGDVNRIRDLYRKLRELSSQTGDNGE